MEMPLNLLIVDDKLRIVGLIADIRRLAGTSPDGAQALSGNKH